MLLAQYICCTCLWIALVQTGNPALAIGLGVAVCTLIAFAQEYIDDHKDDNDQFRST